PAINLTSGQISVLRLVARGLSNRAIADELYAPDKWSLLRNSQGMTQLFVRLEETAIPAVSVPR
ncbi:MAG: hypothetical protein O2828_00790, partial [Actinomycetota bacterium]|nr:hypothetical protein [Actinomycetota bacterium]